MYFGILCVYSNGVIEVHKCNKKTCWNKKKKYIKNMHFACRYLTLFLEVYYAYLLLLLYITWV